MTYTQGGGEFVKFKSLVSQPALDKRKCMTGSTTQINRWMNSAQQPIIHEPRASSVLT